MNAEAWVITNTLLKTGQPVPLALCAAAAQVVSYSVIYFQGPRLLDLWPSVREKLELFDASKYAGWTYGALFLGGTIGFPPTLFFAFLRRQLGFRFPLFLALITAARVIRFLVLASLPALFARYFNA